MKCSAQVSHVGEGFQVARTCCMPRPLPTTHRLHLRKCTLAYQSGGGSPGVGGRCGLHAGSREMLVRYRALFCHCHTRQLAVERKGKGKEIRDKVLT